MSTVLEQIEVAPNVIRFPADLNLTDDQFFEFCVLNRDWRIERTAEGEIQIMSPAGAGASNRNLQVTAQLALWAEKDGTGVAFDSSGGFNLPNGASRSPDASWISRDRLKQLTPEQKEKFLPLCPDFVVELRSPSDRLPDLKRKLEEYIDNGARLGWLINPPTHQVFVYRPGQPVEELDAPQELDASPELPGFVLKLKKIWEPDF